uniref:protein ALP1-like n=1 Tax=Erigeron canadensis TaxID=72917 RepID=UPI001CB8A892|nr:protein ALP1-like [Erigeron canadensis]
MLNTFVTLIEDEEAEAKSSRMAIRPKIPRRTITRNHVEASTRLYNHYFAPQPIFPADYFRRRFRMPKEMFLRIVNDIYNFDAVQPLPPHFAFFHNAPTDAVGRPTLNIFQKCTSAIRQLAYGSTVDQLDEYLEMGAQTSADSLNSFYKCVVQLYHAEFLRKPTQEDVNHVTAKYEAVHGFPGMLGIVDCMHWAWRNCPTAWQDQYTRGDKGHPTIMLEAVASYDLWLWHAYFGPAGSNNDINVLNESDLFDQLLQDRAPAVNFTVNGQQFTKGYYLADGIYPEWATLVKSFKCPMDPKTSKFKRFQESARKDMERAFGVLQGRWRILQQGARPLSINKIKRIMYTCVLLHNMVVKYNGRAISPLDLELIPDNPPTRSWDERVDIQLCMTWELRDRATHNRLRGALVEHIWNLPENKRER